MKTTVTLFPTRTNCFRHIIRTGVFLFLLLISFFANAQAPTIEYPTAAQNITRAYGQSLLTVKLTFNGDCGGAQVRIALPASVSYVPGTINKTAGTAALSITEYDISNPSAPVFDINNAVHVGNDITFTIARQATCGSLATAKDTIYVISKTGCPTGIENSSLLNTYNLLAPSFSLTPAAAISNALVGMTTTRNSSVTNGGNGVTDTLRFYIVYPSAGIINTSGTNSITANGNSFIPTAINGDTLFYKIFGTTIFNGNALFENGETVNISEPIRIVKCNTTTTYAAGWGRSTGNQCQVTKATSVVTMMNGVASGTVALTRRINTLPCTPGIVRITYSSNSSSSGIASAIYDVLPRFGQWDGGGGYSASLNPYITYTNFMLNGTVPVVGVLSGARYTVNLNFTTDPDGAGVGLEDLDADGYYDDLMPGQSFFIECTQTFTSPPLCNRVTYHLGVYADITYSNMCRDQTTNRTNAVSGASYYIAGVTTTKPANCFDAQPFTVSNCVPGNGGNFPDYNATTDSTIIELDIPAGISYVAGSAKFITTASFSPTVINSGSKLIMMMAGRATNGFCFQYDLVYSCGASGNVKIPYKLYFVHDRACQAMDTYECDTIKVNAICSNPCGIVAGFNNSSSPIVRRVNYGWSDHLATVPVDTATLPSVSKKTAIIYDTINVKQGGREIGVHSNLYYTISVENTSTNANVFSFAGGRVYVRQAATSMVSSCAMPTPTTSVVSGQTKWTWNLSSVLGASCGIPAVLNHGDSVWVDMRYRVENAYSTGTLTQPSSNAYFYNIVASAESYCTSWPLDMYLIGIQYQGIGNNGPSAIPFTGCGSQTANIRTYRGTAGLVTDVFPYEIRPAVRKDSIIVTIPAGYSWTGANCTLTYETFGSSTLYVTTPSFVITPIVSGNRLIFKNDGSWPMSDLALTGNRGYDILNIPLSPNCAGVTGTSSILVTEKGTQYVYAGLNNAYTNIQNAGPGNMSLTYSNKPAISLQNNTGAIQGLQPTHYWDITFANPSSQTAPFIWLSVEKAATSGVVVDSVKLMPSGTNIAVAGVYGTGNRWYQVSAVGLSSGNSQNARVFFHYTNCSMDSVELKAGWNCAGYPAGDPTSYACTAASVWLKVDPQPSQVQLSVERQPGGVSGVMDMCNTDSTILVVNSAQAGNLVNPYLEFYPPAGITLASGIQVEFPAGSGNYQPAAISSIGGGGYKLDITSHPAIGANGLPGTGTVASSAGRQARVKIMFNTVCGFTSGSSFAFNAYANRSCGTAAIGNGVSATTQGVRINGVAATGSAGMTIDVGTTSDVSCNASTVVSNTITPTGTSTQAGDTIIYQLPAGVMYAGGLTSGFTSRIEGQTVKIALPANTAAGISISYSFNVTATGSGCSSSAITASFRREIAPLMCGGIACTSSNTIIASRTIGTSINKPNLQLTAMHHINGNWLPGSTSTVDISYGNTGGQNYTANAAVIEFFCGSNTTPFATMPITRNLIAGGSTTEQFNVYVPSTGCGNGDVITARIQTVTASNNSQCLCAPSSYTLPGILLPVVFTNATATGSQCKTDINWSFAQTGSVGDIRFTIERSKDGSSFTSVAAVSQDTKSYSDAVPSSGVWYYRIKAQEAGTNKKVYSNTMRVNVNQCTSAANVKVYPNPAANELHVSIDASTQDANYDLTDMLGRTVAKGRLNSGADNRIDIHKLAAGTYMLKLSLNGMVQTQKINVER